MDYLDSIIDKSLKLHVRLVNPLDKKFRGKGLLPLHPPNPTLIFNDVEFVGPTKYISTTKLSPVYNIRLQSKTFSRN